MDENQRQEELVPGANKGEDRHRSNDRLGQRQHDMPKRPEMVAPIDSRRVNQLRGQSIEVGSEQKYSQRQAACGVRKNKSQEVIGQLEFNHDNIQRNDINLDGYSKQQDKT